ncbi:MAG: HIT family protein [Planctomycetes bacterium]|nr:HIT family protein [Planctomycetota bacterium]
MSDCIFCKIVAGDIPCHEIYSNEHILAFLDIGPLSRGHALVIPKQHHERITQMPEDLMAECARGVHRVSRAVESALPAHAWNILQNNGSMAGQVVMHVHFHIIPRSSEDGLGYRWKPKTLNSSEATAILQSIRDEL